MLSKKKVIRRSLRELDQHPQEKKDFLKAFHLIQNLDPTNPNSFWSLASYHGMPFKTREVDDDKAVEGEEPWDGYCQHDNVLFPTWHRFYCHRLEQSLQTVLPEADNMALPYWDETSDESLEHGMPSILTDEKVTIDGDDGTKTEIDNPLRSFILPRAIIDKENHNAKPEKGYVTKRFPYSGLVYSKKVADESEKHNDDVDKKCKDLTDEDPIQYLQTQIKIALDKSVTNSIYNIFARCLEADSYNVFSNITSAFNLDFDGTRSLEQPHNDIHIVLGVMFNSQIGHSDELIKLESLAHGDMGFNETAAFDPVFFFHHANIDRMFWIWQKKHNAIKFKIDVDEKVEYGKYTGVSNKIQGPTPYQTFDQTLSTKTKLHPFLNEMGKTPSTLECQNIADLGYEYSKGSFDVDKPQDQIPKPVKVHKHTAKFHKDVDMQLIQDLTNDKDDCVTCSIFHLNNVDSKWECTPAIGSDGNDDLIELADKTWKRHYFLKVSNIDKNNYVGSLVVCAFLKDEASGGLNHIGSRGILSRFNRKNCKNCQIHRYASVSFYIANLCPLDNFVIKLRFKRNGKTEEVTLDTTSKCVDQPLIELWAFFKEHKALPAC